VSKHRLSFAERLIRLRKTVRSRGVTTIPKREITMHVKLTIRPAQLAAFSQLQVRRFEDWMAGHLRRFFSVQCDALGEAYVVETVRYGMERASQHGFRTRRDVCKYIDLMMVLGRDFDTDGRTPWAAAILARRGDAGATMRALFAAASRRLQRQ
jgi:hypothetical protein